MKMEFSKMCADPVSISSAHWFLMASLLGVSCVACGSDKAGGLGSGGEGGDGGSSMNAGATGGAAGTGAGETTGGGGAQGGTGASQSSGGGGGALTGGSSGASAAGGTGGTSGGSGGGAGSAGSAGSAGAEPTRCIFHTEGTSAGGAGGAGGTPALTVGVASSPFLGQYLTDGPGITLYTYGSDVPGDCEHAPVSGCEGDCLLSWPLFDADPRLLAAGLNDANFGSFMRSDGSRQTTYLGWPLYYYKNDTSPGLIAGQNKAKLWHAAQVIPVELMVMRNGSIKYLADRWGFAFYSYAGDQLGTDSTDPVAKCTGSCAALARPVRGKNSSHVSSLAESDLSVFTSPGIGQQLAYKGAPLYYSTADAKPGDIAGANVADFALVEP